MRSPHRHRLIRLYVADYVTNSTKRLRLAAPPSLHTPRNASLPITETGFCGRVPLGYKGREVTRHVTATTYRVIVTTYRVIVTTYRVVSGRVINRVKRSCGVGSWHFWKFA